MKRQSEVLEARLWQWAGECRHWSWFSQQSVDGRTIVHAEAAPSDDMFCTSRLSISTPTGSFPNGWTPSEQLSVMGIGNAERDCGGAGLRHPDGGRVFARHQFERARRFAGVHGARHRILLAPQRAGRPDGRAGFTAALIACASSNFWPCRRCSSRWFSCLLFFLKIVSNGRNSKDDFG